MLTFVSALLIAAQASAADPPGDFVLKITFGQCWNEAIDTSASTFSRTLSPGETVTVRVSLTAEQRHRLHGLVVDAEVWSYPPVFEPEGGSLVEELPPSDFTIEVQAGGRSTVIQWLDRASLRPEAVRLRTMLRGIRQLFAERPEVQRLPASRMICL